MADLGSVAQAPSTVEERWQEAAAVSSTVEERWREAAAASSTVEERWLEATVPRFFPARLPWNSLFQIDNWKWRSLKMLHP